MVDAPQSSPICRQHSRSASVRVSETMQAISGVPHTHRARVSAANLQVHFNINSLIALTVLPQFWPLLAAFNRCGFPQNQEEHRTISLYFVTNHIFCAFLGLQDAY